MYIYMCMLGTLQYMPGSHHWAKHVDLVGNAEFMAPSQDWKT